MYCHGDGGAGGFVGIGKKVVEDLLKAETVGVHEAVRDLRNLRAVQVVRVAEQLRQLCAFNVRRSYGELSELFESCGKQLGHESADLVCLPDDLRIVIPDSAAVCQCRSEFRGGADTCDGRPDIMRELGDKLFFFCLCLCGGAAG